MSKALHGQISELEAQLAKARETNRELHRRVQKEESADSIVLRETGYFKQKALADMWSRSWSYHFTRMCAGHQALKPIYEAAAQKLGLPHGRYHSIGDMRFRGKKEEGRLYANVFLSKEGGIETYDIAEVVEKAIRGAEE